MSAHVRRKMNLLDAIALVGSAAIGLGLFELAHRALFRGQWRKPADWIDVMGRVVGVLWIVIGLVWTLNEYRGFV